MIRSTPRTICTPTVGHSARSTSRRPTPIHGRFVSAIVSDDDEEYNYLLAFNHYLQALLEKQISNDFIEKSKIELNEQLIIQQNKVYKTEVKCSNTENELEETKKLEKIAQVVEKMQATLGKFNKLNKDFKLEKLLEELTELLKKLCCTVRVRNVGNFSVQADYDKWFKVLEKCLPVLQRVLLDNDNAVEIKRFAELLTTFKGNLARDELSQTQLSVSKNEDAFKLFKTISDMYVVEQTD